MKARKPVVDNFALVVSQLMLIIVLWRCLVLPEEDGNDEVKKRVYRPKGKTGNGEAMTSDDASKPKVRPAQRAKVRMKS